MSAEPKDQTMDQTELLPQMFPKDSLEYKLLLRYAQKKGNTNGDVQHGNGVAKTTNESTTQLQNNRKPKKKKRQLKILSCFRPVKEDDGPVTKPYRRRAAGDLISDEDDVEQIVNKLSEIADDVHFISSNIETDSDDVVERIVELLREKGDQLNEEIKKNHVLQKQLQESLSYGFFEKLTLMFMKRLSPNELPTTQSRQQAKIALTCELTSRLNAIDNHPMNRVLGFGAKYLQDHFTPWVIQQGGYEKVFDTDADAEEEEVQ
ncbi:Apoptosis facilitator Bcl-2-like protein 14 [Bagarius yarrelli]|uniref:Apoptosis facilitator Bcl-2-like protein 14 n=1 Tax=Bagarius yarrelli TaxID=175774 RepID=A0A556TH97_BAGYA|nr:Apoptosis facilitator Bcl-2-like protein 14 [Bagarius yarrelli]